MSERLTGFIFYTFLATMLAGSSYFALQIMKPDTQDSDGRKQKTVSQNKEMNLEKDEEKDLDKSSADTQASNNKKNENKQSGSSPNDGGNKGKTEQGTKTITRSGNNADAKASAVESEQSIAETIRQDQQRSQERIKSISSRTGKSRDYWRDLTRTAASPELSKASGGSGSSSGSSSYNDSGPDASNTDEAQEDAADSEETEQVFFSGFTRDPDDDAFAGIRIYATTATGAAVFEGEAPSLAEERLKTQGAVLMAVSDSAGRFQFSLPASRETALIAAISEVEAVTLFRGPLILGGGFSGSVFTLRRNLQDDTVGNPVPFIANFIDGAGSPVPQVEVYMTTDTSIHISQEDSRLQSLEKIQRSNSRLVAVADANGFVSFNLDSTPQTVVLLCVSDSVVLESFRSPVNFETAWSYRTISLIPPGSSGSYTVKGMVVDRWENPISGALIANRPLGDLAGHEASKNEAGYLYTYSASDGTYSLPGLNADLSYTFSCIVVGQDPQTRSEPSPGPGGVLTDINFAFSEAGPAPGLWKGRVLTTDGEGASNVLVSIHEFSDYQSASYGDKGTMTDYDGNFSIDNIPPLQPVTLYLYHEVLGKVKLAERSFDAGEVFEGQYPTQLGGSEPGALGFRLQDSRGIDIRKGWIVSQPVANAEQFESLVQSNGIGVSIPEEGVAWVEDIPSWQPLRLWFSNELGEQVELGEYTLLSAERRNLGLIRLSQQIRMSAELSLTIVQSDGMPYPDIKVEAFFGGEEKASEATTNKDGIAVLKSLQLDRVVTLVASNDLGHQQTLKENYLVENTYVYGDTYTFTAGAPVEFITLNEKSAPVPNARISLTNKEGKIFSAKTDAHGKAAVSDLAAETDYKFSIFHPFYESVEEDAYRPVFDSEPAEFQLKTKKGVKVQLHGDLFPEDVPEDWEGIYVRAFIGVEKDGYIVPDFMPGNEYAERITRPEMLFLTPPEEPFWIFLGSLPAPWADKLYGPFQPGDSDVIEGVIEQVEPLRVSLQGMENRPGFWNLAVYDLSTMNNYKGQIFSGQYNTAISPDFYLARGKYLIKVYSNGYETAELEYDFSGSETTLELQLQPLTDQPPKGGYIKSYLVSDRFPLVLSEENYHWNQICYGFSIDWLSHLPGQERSFQSVHLGDWPDLEGEGRITWRRMDFDNGVLNFKQLYPGTTGDYSVCYAQFRLDFPWQQQAVLAVGADDGVKAWVNGQLKIYEHLPRALGEYDQYTAPVTLQAGINQFNFKVGNSWGRWELRVRLIDPNTNTPIINLDLDPPGGQTTIQYTTSP